MKNSKTRGATKVPNVKLRPVQPSSSWASKRQTSLPRVRLGEEDAGQDEVDLDAGNKPFEGLVICATGDLDKRKLFARAQELGANRANDFTDQVTHLIADAPGSAKYKCAVERSLPILKASWIQEAYKTWLGGDIVDLVQTVSDHRLPIFSGVRLCITGMDDISLRGKIHTLLATENGTYLKSLDHSATHLLCCAPEESPKMRWAREYNQIRRETEQIYVVWEEWFWDSLEFGGRWDEHEYQVTNPRPLRKSLSQIPHPVNLDSSQKKLPTSVLSQRTPLPCSLPTASLLSDDPPECGTVNRIPDAGLRIFESIVQKRGYAVGSDGAIQRAEHTNAKLLPAPTTSVPIAPAKQRPEVARVKPMLKAVVNANTDSVLSRLSNHRAASFASSSSQQQSRQPFRRSNSISSSATVDCAITLQTSSTNGTSGSSHLFAGYTFRAFGEANGLALRTAVEVCGGRWLAEDKEDEDADFLVVRLVSGGMFWRDEGEPAVRAKYRTECWVERCIFEERICKPQEHVVFTPLRIDTPIAGSEKLHVSLSGLDSAEMCWVKRLVRALGGNVPANFSRRSSHLLCPSKRGAKYDKAKEWGVSVVDMKWLITLATTGEVQSTRGFGVVPETEGAPMDVTDAAAVNSTAIGKGKAIELEAEGGVIVDITNDHAGVLQESWPLKPLGASSGNRKSNPEAKRPTPPRLQSFENLTDPAAAPIDDWHSESALTFGQPNGLLPAAPELSKQEQKSDFNPSPPRILHPPFFSQSVPPKSKHATRRFSAAEIEQDKQTTLIPSSHTPSPLKIPSEPTSVSPPPMGETRGLRTAITALLGKRSIESRETEETVQKPQGRTNKRPRVPPRGKSDLEGGPSPALSFMSGSPPLSRLPTHEEASAISEEEQSSLRVVYEDPVQRAEKKRLIALFEGGSAAHETKTGRSKPSAAAGRKHTASSFDANTGSAPTRKPARRSTRKIGV